MVEDTRTFLVNLINIQLHAYMKSVLFYIICFRFSVWLNRNDALTLDELMKGFEASYNPHPTSIVQSSVFNFSEWIVNSTNPMSRHSKPHVFKIFNENGKARIVCKKWSTDKVGYNCILLKYLHSTVTNISILPWQKILYF